MRDASAYHVGPLGDPDRFTLTHLLGSGGEGEVWRAVRTDGTGSEVAIKINRRAGDDAAAGRRLRELIGVVIDGLVRVYDVFDAAERHRGDDAPRLEATHRYVVMSYVEGITLRTWLDEHPDSPPRRRVQVLRGVAHTLSALHDGLGDGYGLTHGDIKPANVIIGADGRPVLVDLGLMRSMGSGPASGRTAAYSSPELRHPDAVPTARTDTFSFAVTAMETLTGLIPPLDADGRLDVAATESRIRHAVALRRRPFLRRQLLRSLAIAPDERPATPMRVFAARTFAMVLVPLLVLAGASVAAAAVALGDDAGPSRGLAPAGPGGSGGPGSGGTTTFGPQMETSGTVDGVVVDRPTDDNRQEKMKPANPVPKAGSLLHAAITGGTPTVYRHAGECLDVSNALPELGEELAAWGDAPFWLTFVADRTVRVLDVSRDRLRIPQPARLEQELDVSCIQLPEVGGTCGDQFNGHGNAGIRTATSYLFDLDHNQFREKSTRDRRPFGVYRSVCGRPSVLRLDTRNCTGSWALSVTVRYEVIDEPGIVYSQTFSGFRSRGRMVDGAFTTMLNNGLGRHTTRDFTSGPPGCARRGIAARTPYRSVAHEAEELLVGAVAKRRRSVGSLEEALRQVTMDARPIIAEIDAYWLRGVCDRAAAGGKAWRGTCGPPDPTPSAAGDPTPSIADEDTPGP